jgi:hypothetical protein
MDEEMARRSEREAILYKTTTKNVTISRALQRRYHNSCVSFIVID